MLILVQGCMFQLVMIDMVLNFALVSFTSCYLHHVLSLVLATDGLMGVLTCIFILDSKFSFGILKNILGQFFCDANP